MISSSRASRSARAPHSRLSYRDRRSHRKRRFRFAGMIVLLLGIYFLVTLLVAETWKMESESMAPGHPPGTRFVVVRRLFRKRNAPLFPFRAFSRGDIAAVAPPYAVQSGPASRFLDALVRFFTLQRRSIGNRRRQEWENELIFKRIAALPGDTIKIEGSVAYVRGPDDNFYLSEFERSGKGYDLVIPDVPENWSAEFPLSGSLEPVTLGEDEYFVLGDNRPESNDSRYWGVVKREALRGRVVFIYWPPRVFGRPQ